MINKTPLLDTFDEMYAGWRQAVDRFVREVREIDHELPDIQPQIIRLKNEVLRLAGGKKNLTNESRRTISTDTKHVRYAFLAYCDDYMLQRFSWPGISDDLAAEARKFWLSRLCEDEGFGTRTAGHTLPERVKKLTETQHPTAEQIELAQIYSRILWLGFGPVDERFQGYLLDLSRKLASLIDNNRPKDISDSTQPLGWLPSQTQVAQRLAPLRRWQLGFGIAFMAFLGITLALWLFIYFGIDGLLTELGS
jgi:type VI protein secretion system component VasF